MFIDPFYAIFCDQKLAISCLSIFIMSTAHTKNKHTHSISAKYDKCLLFCISFFLGFDKFQLCFINSLLADFDFMHICISFFFWILIYIEHLKLKCTSKGIFLVELMKFTIRLSIHIKHILSKAFNFYLSKIMIKEIINLRNINGYKDFTIALAQITPLG